MGLDRGRETLDGNHSPGAARKARGGKEIENSLLFTLPYLLFILLQNFTRTFANLHARVEHRGTKQQKIKSISHPKRHK